MTYFPRKGPHCNVHTLISCAIFKDELLAQGKACSFWAWPFQELALLEFIFSPGNHWQLKLALWGYKTAKAQLRQVEFSFSVSTRLAGTASGGINSKWSNPRCSPWHTQTGYDGATPTIYTSPHYFLKDRKQLHKLLKLKFKILKGLIGQGPDLAWGFCVCLLLGFSLNFLCINTSKIWKFLTVADFEFIEQKISDQNMHGNIFVWLFFFSANINKLFNWFCINFPKKKKKSQAWKISAQNGVYLRKLQATEKEG